MGELVYYAGNGADGVRIASWLPANADRCTQVHILIPVAVGTKVGEVTIRFNAAFGLDSFIRELQAHREQVFGFYGHIPTICTHCKAEIPRGELDALRAHTMTCEKNPLVVLLGEKCRRLAELQAAYEKLVAIARPAEVDGGA